LFNYSAFSDNVTTPASSNKAIFGEGGHSTTRYLCSICNQSFANQKGLNMHTMRKHSDKSNNLSTSGKSISEAGKGGHSTSRYLCNICNQSFANQKGLNMHSVKKHSDKPNNLSTSGKSISEAGKCGHATTRYLCSICNQSFANQKGLNMHTEKKHSNKSNNLSTSGKSLNEAVPENAAMCEGLSTKSRKTGRSNSVSAKEMKKQTDSSKKNLISAGISAAASVSGPSSSESLPMKIQGSSTCDSYGTSVPRVASLSSEQASVVDRFTLQHRGTTTKPGIIKDLQKSINDLKKKISATSVQSKWTN
jgi:transposase-like protein